MSLRCLFLVFVQILIFAPSDGQDTLRTNIAEDICNCISDVDGRSENGRARLCLLRVGGKYAQEIEAAYQLSVRSRDDRIVLVDTIAEELSLGCPELVTYLYGEEKAERWSDKPVSEKFRFNFSKMDSLLVPERRTRYADRPAFVSELPEKVIILGVVKDLTPLGELSMKTERGMKIVLLSNRLRAKHPWAIGQSYELTCRRVVSDDGRRIILEVVDVE